MTIKKSVLYQRVADLANLATQINIKNMKYFVNVFIKGETNYVIVTVRKRLDNTEVFKKPISIEATDHTLDLLLKVYEILESRFLQEGGK